MYKKAFTWEVSGKSNRHQQHNNTPRVVKFIGNKYI